MTHRGLVLGGLLATALLLLAPMTTAQLPMEGEPEVEFPNVIVAPPIEPGSPTPVMVTATVGCSQGEAPETENKATMTVVEPPAGVSVDLEPATSTWTNSAGACGVNATAHEVNVTATVTLQSQVPALEAQTIGLQLTVEKAPPAGEAQTYGPYNASLTVTPAYQGRFSVSLEDKTVEVPANQTAAFPVAIENRGNGETQFSLSLGELPEGVVAEGASETLILAPGGNGTVTVELSLQDPSIDSLVSHSVELVVDGGSTDPDGGPAGNETRSLTARFQPVDDGSPIPGPGVGLAALAVTLGALVLRREAL